MTVRGRVDADAANSWGRPKLPQGKGRAAHLPLPRRHDARAAAPGGQLRYVLQGRVGQGCEPPGGHSGCHHRRAAGWQGRDRRDARWRRSSHVRLRRHRCPAWTRSVRRQPPRHHAPPGMALVVDCDGAASCWDRTPWGEGGQQTDAAQGSSHAPSSGSASQAADEVDGSALTRRRHCEMAGRRVHVPRKPAVSAETTEASSRRTTVALGVRTADGLEDAPTAINSAGTDSRTQPS